MEPRSQAPEPTAGAHAPERLRYGFGPFVLDTATRRLFRHGFPVPITTRVFDVLCLLVERHGRPVEKQTFIERVGGDLAVEDDSLARSVSTLRTTLGGSPGDRRYVAILPGRGYQLVAPVHVITHGVELLPEVPQRMERARDGQPVLAGLPERFMAVVRWAAGLLLVGLATD